MRTFHKDSSGRFYKREVIEGKRVWWHAWRDHAWYVISGKPSVKLMEVETMEDMYL